MTARFIFAANPLTYLELPDSALVTLPNSDWLITGILCTNSGMAGSAEYIFSTGPYAAAGALSFALNPSAGQLFAYVDTDSAPTCTLSAGIGANQVWAVAIGRKNNAVFTMACPKQATMPTSGAAVLTSSTRALSKELDGPRPPRIGARANGTTVDRMLDQSLGRLSIIHGSMTPLEFAQFAHGMSITDLGKTPVWNIRMNDGSDTSDIGPNALSVTRSTGATPFVTGTDPAFAYVPPASAPVFTSPPSITGAPTVGVAASYTAGSRSGSVPITDTFQWLLNGQAVGTTFTPAASDVGKTLEIKQTATNSQGSVESTSASKTISAAATVNSITVTPPANESIFAHTNGARNVAMAVTYEGDTPATIEYQLYASDGVTVRKAWSAVSFSGGAISPSIATSLRKQRIAVRSKNSAGTILATSAVHANRFAVGHLVYMGGSSGAQAWGNLMSGSAYDSIDGDIVGQFRSGVWGQGTVKSYATRMAMTLSTALGMAVGMVHNGVSGTSLKGAAGWSTWTSSSFTNARAAIGEVGGKVSSFMFTVGSNDAGNPGGVVSQADHLFYIRQLIQNLRDTVLDQSLPGLWVGMNRRTGTTATAEVYENQANWLRAAENQVGDDANVFHVQTLDFEMHGDQVHLTDAGIFAQTTRMAYIMVEALAGRYHRGPKITALTYSGTDLFIDVQHRNGSDLAPASGGTGISLSDANGTPALVSTARVSAARYRATFDRVLVAPVNAKYLSGGAPDPTAPIVDNGTVPLPMHAETQMVTTAASVEPAIPTVTSVTVSPSTATDSATFTATVNGTNSPSQGVTWTASAGSISSSGVFTAPAKTSSVQTITITARSNFDTTKSGTATVTLAAIVPPDNPDVNIGVIDATKVPLERRVVFEGSKRVVSFPGSIHKVEF